MATSSIAGYKGVAAFSTATGQAVTGLVEMRNFNLTAEHAEIDATSHDSSGDREVIAGTGNWSGTVEFLHVQAEATHQELVDVLLARTKIDAEFYPTGSSSDGYYSGSGYFNSWELASPNDDAEAANAALVGTGALTRTSSA
jgi:hypothetical protein